MPLPEQIKELRPHATWEVVREGFREGIKMMLPFLAGLGIQQWISNYRTQLMWTAAIIVAAAIAYWDRLPRRMRAAPSADPLQAGKPAWQRLQWANAERERLEKEVEQLKAAQSAPSVPFKLTIHRAVYGGGPLAEILVTDKLQNAVREALIVSVDSTLGGLVDDPARNVQKCLEVEYSFGSDRKLVASRMEASPGEITRLVLPEDTEIKKLKGSSEKFMGKLGLRQLAK
jgi:hypothetical protein